MVFLVIIVTFNVLIAIVSDRYNEVMETAEVEVRKLRALMIVEEQALMSSAEKRDEQYFPPYLEVLQSNVQPSSSSELSELRGEVWKVESKVDAMAADMAAMKALMEGLASAKK